jgi:hypothetical protein
MIYLEVRIKTEDIAIHDILNLFDVLAETALGPQMTIRLELTGGLESLSLDSRARLEGIQRRLHPRLYLIARDAWSQPQT